MRLCIPLGAAAGLAFATASGGVKVESIQLLKQIYIFQELTSLEMIQINKIVHTRRIKAGDQIIKEGAAPDYMYVVKEGKVRVCRQGDELAVLQQGDHFGEIALIDHGPRSADVVALEDGELLTISQQEFRTLLEHDTSIRLKVYEAFLTTLCSRLRSANDSVMVSQRISGS